MSGGRERIKTFSLSKVTLQFEDGEKIFENISLELPLGQCVGIYGGDASGKSLLLRIMAGLERPTSGQVLYNEKDMNKTPFEQLVPLRLSTAFCFDNGGVMMNKTVDENLKLALNYHNQWRSGRSQNLFNDLVQDFRLQKFLSLRPAQVPPSIRKVTGLVRCFLSNPQILFLDEPSLGIGADALETLKKWIIKFRENSMADALVLFSTQDQSFIDSIGAVKWELKNGKINIPKVEPHARAV